MNAEKKSPLISKRKKISIIVVSVIVTLLFTVLMIVFVPVGYCCQKLNGVYCVNGSDYTEGCLQYAELHGHLCTSRRYRLHENCFQFNGDEAECCGGAIRKNWRWTLFPPEDSYNCNYIYDTSCYGRPYETDNGYLMPSSNSEKSNWITQLHPLLEGMTEEERKSAAANWSESGLEEQSSVASFSKFSLQLLAVGAPPDLIRRAHLAAIDEIKHAELSFGLASAFAGHPVSPGPYPAHSLTIEPDMEYLCTSTAREGCLSETKATLKATRELQTTLDPAVRMVLQVIIDEETIHAALAWDTIRWCVNQEPELKEKLKKVFNVSGSDIASTLIKSLRQGILWNEPVDETIFEGQIGVEVEVARNIFKLVMHKSETESIQFENVTTCSTTNSLLNNLEIYRNHSACSSNLNS